MSFAPVIASSTVATLNAESSLSVFINSAAFASKSLSFNSSIASARGSRPFSIATIPRVFFFFLNGAHKSSSSVKVEALIAALYRLSVSFP